MMKKLFQSKLSNTLMAALAVVLALALTGFQGRSGSASSADSAESAIRWQRDEAEAFQVARQQNKLLFVDVYADWCSWCRKLDKDVFSNQAFAEFLETHFVPLKIDSDRNRSFAERHQVSALPTMLILQPDGASAGRITGFKSADQLENQLKSLLERLKAHQAD